MKRKIKLVCLIAFATIVWNGNASAQTWTLAQTIDSVDLFYSITTCGSDRVVFLKFVNNKSNNVTVNWSEVFDTQLAQNVTGYSSPKQLNIAPGVTKQANCSSTATPECIIRGGDVNPTYIAVILSFKFTNITVH